MLRLDLTSSYHYELPEELIAHEPLTHRDQCRLLVIDRARGSLTHARFCDVESYLEAGDCLVLNNTKVIPARLNMKRKTGGKVELLLLKSLGNLETWEVLCKPARKVCVGDVLYYSDFLTLEVLEEKNEGIRVVRFSTTNGRRFLDILEEEGQMPLPPYIQRKEARSSDKQDYQTVFAQNPGAVAAPTAGLHFTQELLDRLNNKGVKKAYVTLHVGMGTFKPVQVEELGHHVMHEEYYELTASQADILKEVPPLKRKICVGTTSLRVVESVFQQKSCFEECSGMTNLFIYPPYTFQGVDALITNFHLPSSTLLMLVCAFGGYDLMMKAYQEAIEHKYRFFSYGDAMLIL